VLAYLQVLKRHRVQSNHNGAAYCVQMAWFLYLHTVESLFDYTRVNQEAVLNLAQAV
jgi:hypothetical protein